MAPGAGAAASDRLISALEPMLVEDGAVLEEPADKFATCAAFGQLRDGS